MPGFPDWRVALAVAKGLGVRSEFSCSAWSVNARISAQRTPENDDSHRGLPIPGGHVIARESYHFDRQRTWCANPRGYPSRAGADGTDHQSQNFEGRHW